MNPEQTKSLIRWAVTVFGGLFAGYIAGKGWADAKDVLGVVNSDTFIQGISALISVIGLIWGLFAHSEKNVAAAAASMPNVEGVITTNTNTGIKLAKSIPDPSVAPKGSLTAAQIAVVKNAAH